VAVKTEVVLPPLKVVVVVPAALGVTVLSLVRKVVCDISMELLTQS
jgi:hypothetical protein